MNTFVSGESDAKGLSVILPYIAVGPAAVAIRRPELLGTLGIWLGVAGHGRARRGKEYGMERPGEAWHGAARRGKARHGRAR